MRKDHAGAGESFNSASPVRFIKMSFMLRRVKLGAANSCRGRRYEWQQMKIKAISENKRNLITKRTLKFLPPLGFLFVKTSQLSFSIFNSVFA